MCVCVGGGGILLNNGQLSSPLKYSIEEFVEWFLKLYQPRHEKTCFFS